MSHVDKSDLVDSLQSAARQVEIGDTYIHYKNSASRYIVEKLVIKEADDSVEVLYHDPSSPGISFTRPLAEWLEEVDGKPRFTPLAGQET